MTTIPVAPSGVWDALVVGGGPAGTTVAHLLARQGRSVLLVEKQTYPRFCIGESLLPATTPIWKELGIYDRMVARGFIKKYGAYFCFPDGRKIEYFGFADATNPHAAHAFEVTRADFDQLLWDAAVEQGVQARQGVTVQRFRMDGDRCVGADVRDGEGTDHVVQARLTFDCTGRLCELGRQLGIRRPHPVLDKIALYSHFDDVIRSSDDDAGTIGIVATDFGWIWIIPFSGDGTSVGAVMHREWYTARKDKGPEGIWEDVLAAAPHAANRLRGARRSRDFEVKTNFQHHCDHLAGDGWVMVGDSGAFLDPVFSSGVHLAMSAGRRAAQVAGRALAQDRLPVRADFVGYERWVRGGLSVFSKFIHAWYDPWFREVFMNPPHGKPGMKLLKSEIIAILAGDVFTPWRRLPALSLLMFFARLRARQAAGALPPPRAA